MQHWYVLHTKPRCEHKVALRLRQKGAEYYLPEFGSGPQHAPFFPTYLFLRTDLQATGLSAWKWIPGLHGVVSYGEQPVFIPDEWMATLQQKITHFKESQMEAAMVPFSPGEVVRIVKGPLVGLLARFERPLQAGQRVELLLTFLGHLRRLQIDTADVEKAPQDTSTLRDHPPRRTRGRGRRIKQ